MLVLTRKENERIRIGDNIEITVVRVSGKRVRIGIEAPKNVAVTRPYDAPRDESADVPAEAKPEAPAATAGPVFDLQHILQMIEG